MAKEFDDLRDKSILPWCIAAVPPEMWARELYKEDNAVDILWDKIFDICSIKEDNPIEIWNKKIEKLQERGKKLTEYQFNTSNYA